MIDRWPTILVATHVCVALGYVVLLVHGMVLAVRLATREATEGRARRAIEIIRHVAWGGSSTARLTMVLSVAVVLVSLMCASSAGRFIPSTLLLAASMLVLVPGVIGMAGAVRVLWRAEVRLERGHCAHCGYPLGASEPCTECGLDARCIPERRRSAARDVGQTTIALLMAVVACVGALVLVLPVPSSRVEATQAIVVPVDENGGTTALLRLQQTFALRDRRSALSAGSDAGGARRECGVTAQVRRPAGAPIWTERTRPDVVVRWDVDVDPYMEHLMLDGGRIVGREGAAEAIAACWAPGSVPVVELSRAWSQSVIRTAASCSAGGPRRGGRPPKDDCDMERARPAE